MPARAGMTAVVRAGSGNCSYMNIKEIGWISVPALAGMTCLRGIKGGIKQGIKGVLFLDSTILNRKPCLSRLMLCISYV